MGSLNLSNREFIERLYLTFMDRQYDDDGLNFWLNYLSQGHTRQELVLGFTRSAEFKDKCIEARCLPY